MIAIITTTFFCAEASELKTLKPSISQTQDVSKENIDRWQQNELALRKGKGIAKENYAKGFSETSEGPWSTMTLGDSWYDEAQLYKQTASSALPTTKTINYSAQSLHDSDIRTAWIESKDDYGIGESVSFFFKPNSPRVTQILIWNGYQKSPELYEKNSRPKMLELHINGIPQYRLQLEDTRALQTFSIDPIRSEEEGVDLELKLKIIEVYQGSKWKDTAISEINFNGLDVY
jgi:hypothetical protein